MERMPLWSEIEAGLERSLAGAQDEAARIFERVLSTDANNVLAMKFLGAYAIERGDLARGIALNERVLATGLHTEDARRNLVIAHERRGAELARAGSTRKAIAAYRRIMELDESNLDARERLGALLHRAGASAEARQAFEFVLARDPARRAPALSLAILQLEAGEVEEAVRRLEPLTSGWEGAAQAQAYLRAAQRRLASK
jgi:cytochrome c-type biogenesis protein CcmH/NrfG